MKVGKEFTFDCAHRLPFHTGKCKNLHGHTYRLIVEVEQPDDEVKNMVIDFGDLKEAVNEIIEHFDHSILIGGEDAKDVKMLNYFRKQGWKYRIFEFNTTAENLSRHIAGLIKLKLQSKGSKLDRINFGLTVRLYETPTSYAEVTIR